MTFEERLDLILFQVKETLIKKNADYGNSFEEQFKEYGLLSYLIRDDDKTRRLKNLINNQNLVDESIQDTMLDKVGYGLLGLMCVSNNALLGQICVAHNKQKVSKIDDHLLVPTSRPPYADLDD